MLFAISNSIEETIWKELNKAIAFGIMVNESSDIHVNFILLSMSSIVYMERLKFFF
jgi:hypothetical protein